jgi:hypothetical protein
MFPRENAWHSVALYLEVISKGALQHNFCLKLSRATCLQPELHCVHLTYDNAD